MKEYTNLNTITKTKKTKNVLLVNPRRITSQVNIPHMGLAILAAILKKRGHKVLVVDYQLIHSAPKISYFMDNFKPDIVGISIYTASTNEATEIIKEIHNKNSALPLLVGGPHATLYPEDLEKNKKIDYVLRGEAEPLIIDLVEKSKKQKKPLVILPKTIIDPNNIPYSDYKAFYRWQDIKNYPIMTSRGCPYQCSFCPVGYIGQKKWRPRKPEICIDEILKAKEELNKNLHIFIQDDNGLVIHKRFYEFLELFKKKVGLRISIANLRADDITDKLLTLLRESGCNSIGVAVESSNEEVFKLVNKGETLETIENAVKLVKKKGFLLSLCFVIGLPKDNLKKIQDSIDFAKKYKPDTIYWNMAMPYKNTSMRSWFETNGRIIGEIGKTSLSDGDFRCDEPAVETPDFTSWERKKAHYTCLFQTVDDRLKVTKIIQIFNEARKYNELKDFVIWFPNGILKSLKRKLELIDKFLEYSKREGFKEAIKRGIFLIRQN